MLNCCIQTNPIPIDKIKIQMPDPWTGKANGQTEIRLTSNNKDVGYITYICSTGEIRNIWINSNYSETYFSNILLSEAIKDIKNFGNQICWISNSNENNLWKKINKKFTYGNPINQNINKEGFYMYL